MSKPGLKRNLDAWDALKHDIKGDTRLRGPEKSGLLWTLRDKYPSFILNEATIVNMTKEATTRVYTLLDNGWIYTKIQPPGYHQHVYTLLPPEGDERRNYGTYHVSVPLGDILVSVPHFALMRNAGLRDDEFRSSRLRSPRSSTDKGLCEIF